MKMAVAFGESEDAGGDARVPSLGPRSPIGVGDRLRGDDGWCAGMTLPVWKAAPGAIFIAKTMALLDHIRAMKMAVACGKGYASPRACMSRNTG